SGTGLPVGDAAQLDQIGGWHRRRRGAREPFQTRRFLPPDIDLRSLIPPVQRRERLVIQEAAAVFGAEPRVPAGVCELQGRLVGGDEVVVLFLCRSFAEQRDVVVVRPD